MFSQAPVQALITPDDGPRARQGQPGFSTQVRLATREAHRRLEDTAVMRNLMAPGLTLAAYLTTLQLWHRCWHTLEAELADGLLRGMPPALMPASRLHLLRCDLAFLQTLVSPTSELVPTAARLFNVTDTEHGWYGLAYVVQGSLLGGALLRKRLMQSLPFVDTRGTEFFAGGIDPQALHRQWQGWLALADCCLKTPLAIREAIAAANSAFAHMETVFSYGRLHRE